MNAMHDVALPGCVPQVLAGYLKALGVHRLISDQADQGALSRWDGSGVFHLVSALDEDALVAFLCERYAPTPLVTPWNGSSGFYPKDQQAGIAAIAASHADRFMVYREIVAACRQVLGELGLEEKPQNEDKLRLLGRLRAVLPDAAVAWLDAAVVLVDRALYPPLLGTGGNDGHLDFANTFMQRLAELFLLPRKAKRGAEPAEMLRAALFGQARPGVMQSKLKFGQFAPALAGGTNMTAGVEDEGRANPWDFVLALEGSLALAGAAVRRLDSGQHGNAAFPFHVNASAVGYSSAAGADRRKASCELWLPAWSAPASFPELQRFFGEGRLELGGRRAASGLDAARAVACLGLDRGVERFERLAILERRGQSNIAAWLGTFRVPRVRVGGIDLLGDLDAVLARLERADDLPGPVAAAGRGLLAAVFDACRQGGEEQEPRLTEVLTAAGRLARALRRSPKARERLGGVGRLRREWYERAGEDSAEFRIATAFVSQGHPLERWTEQDPLKNIVDLALRRLREGRPGEEAGAALGGTGRGRAIDGAALCALLAGRIDRQRLADLVFGLSLLEELGSPVRVEVPDAVDLARAGALFGLLRAATSPVLLREFGSPVPGRAMLALIGRLLAGDVPEALALAEGRLRAGGLRPRVMCPVGMAGTYEERLALAAALVLPLRAPLERKFIDNVVRVPDAPPSKENAHGQLESA